MFTSSERPPHASQELVCKATRIGAPQTPEFLNVPWVPLKLFAEYAFIPIEFIDEVFKLICDGEKKAIVTLPELITLERAVYKTTRDPQRIEAVAAVVDVFLSLCPCPVEKCLASQLHNVIVVKALARSQPQA